MTDQVMVRDVPVGGGAPVSVQSMINVDAHDEKGIIRQIHKLEAAGCEIIRLSIPDQEALDVFSRVRKQTDSPLVADIHFNYLMALGAIRAGADKIRINPGNIGDVDHVRSVVKAAKAHHIPIRVGVNSGSVEKDILEKNKGHVTAEALAESALRNADRIDDMGFHDLVLSLKASDVKINYDAYCIASARTAHPLHIGVTEAGTLKTGKIKSAAGIGALLLSGIGDTIRVSLTADPVEEVVFGRELLEAVGIRKPRVEFVSCPTCGRTGIDLEKLAETVQQRMNEETDIPSGLKIAIMGCVVNGPGEGREADFAVCGGRGKGMITMKGKVLKTVPEAELADALIDAIRENT